MTFKQWLFSSYPNTPHAGQWGPVHIAVLLTCIATIVAIALIFRKRSEKTRKTVLWVLVGIILFFEITRRVLNFIKMDTYTLEGVLYNLVPRPWCAIACWSLIISAFVRKKFFYNFASITALLCAIIYFAYPGAGFNDKYFLFENVYSITTHSMLLVTSISLITLKFTDFRYKGMWKELICLAVVYLYAALEIPYFKNDPLYFMPEGDIQHILGVCYAAYLIIYIVFITIYVNLFYLINDRKNVFKKRK